MIKLMFPATVLIFLAAPDFTEIKERLDRRGTESAADREQRLAVAARELACLPGYDYVVMNRPGRIEEAVDDIQSIILAERCRLNVPPVQV